MMPGEGAMTVLVVGGNGQLGAACCAELVARGVPVRATVRDPARATRLPADAAVVQLDLEADQERLRAALTDVDTLILSANSAAPRRGDRPGAVEQAVLDLVDLAGASGVRRVVLPSLPVTAVDDRVPMARARRELERRLADTPLEAWVLRLPPFMEVWLALVGSSLPVRGEPFATVGRPSPFLRRFRSVTGSLVEDRGVMLVPGAASARHAFIAVPDAARACVEATQREGDAPEPLQVAGPEVLSWREVADTFGRLLGRRVRVATTPQAVYAAAAVLLRPLGDVPARTMALNRYLAAHETAWPTPGGGLLDPGSMTTVEELLQSKLALGDDVPDVP
jgi:uncharacterized protein YbjT (DUF2867 family)